tara:strand:+ start:611 stop:943 length:333 start_codon:yes stop_codon:yes gene_type:complete
MSSNKNIQNHLDQLMNSAENPNQLSTSPDFEDKLFVRFDAIDAQIKPKSATIFSFSEMQKYAAVILFLILNISVILFYTISTDNNDDPHDIVSEYSNEYFPDYATLTSLE